MSNELLLIISNILTGIASFFVGKRRSDVETDNMVLKNLELSIGVYQKIIEDLKSEIHELNLKIDILEKKVEELMKENKKLRKTNI
jgi:peptidoglycan hydrolase CwlO-like protein